MSEPFQPLSRPRISLSRFAFYFITLAAIVLIYLKFSEVQLIRELFLRSNLFWLLGVIVTQAVSYYFIALNYRDVLRVKDLSVSIRELFPVTFVVQFLNQALPSAGISGQAFFIQYLKKFSLTVADGIGRAILELTTLYMSFGVFFIISAVMMFRSGIIDKHPEATYFIYAFSFFAVIAVSLFFFFQRRGRGKFARWLINKLHRYFEKKNKKKGKDNLSDGDHSSHVAMIFDQFKATLNYGALKKRGRYFWMAFFWQNMIMLVNVVTLYFISFAIGHEISFGVAFITFTLTKFLSMVSFIPGALGVFEGGMTLILISFGVSAEPAFAMTLLLRAFTFWFPMPIGWILYRWYLHRQELENPYESA
ncbi:MAG: lysylphosphatidylglycerol synthase transmembrane domain-containing protein [Patescibacteria group bacterium]